MFKTRAGWLDKHEVTEVWFDPKILSFDDLLAHGVHADCAQNVWTANKAHLATATKKIGARAQRLTTEPRPDKQPKYYLSQTPFQYVPMTAAQATRCNAVLAPKATGHPKQWLSPRQLALLQRIKKAQKREWPNAIGVPITKAWARLR